MHILFLHIFVNRTSDTRAICNYIYKPSIETDVCVGIVNRHRMTV